MEWRNWTELGGNLKAGATPAMAGTIRRDLSLVARLLNGRVGLCFRSTAGWFAWQDMGLSCRDNPATTIQQDRLIIAARGTDDGLWVGGFQQWTPCGGALASGPSIAAWKLDGNAEIFARGADGTLQWYSFRDYGAATRNPAVGTQQITGTPAAIAPGPDGIHVIARRAGDAHLIHAVWDYNHWSAWTDLGEVASSSPCVVSRDVQALEIYFADPGGALVRRSYTVGANQQLVSAGPREVLAPVLLGDPAAASFGTWHVEVFQRQANGVLARVYAEGVTASDDAGLELLGGQLVDSAPSLWAQAQDVVVCVARNASDQLVSITNTDGYWGEWQNHGGDLDSDPVIVTRLASSLDVFARNYDQQLTRWTLQGSQWSGPVALPSLSPGWCLDQPRAFSDWQGGVRVVTRVNGNRLKEAVIGPDSSFRGWNALAATGITQQPELVAVSQNTLPAPFPSAWPREAMQAGTWVVAPGANGALRGQLFAGGSWGPWRDFSLPACPVRRPIAIAKDYGVPYATVPSLVYTARQAGWIGRAPNGDLLLQRMVWLRTVFGRVAAVVLDTSPWTATTPRVELVADPTGVEYHEPFPNNPDLSVYRVTHLFGRGSRGFLNWAALPEPISGPLDWQWIARDYRLGGDVAPLCQWSSYENRHVLFAAAVTIGRTLLVGTGGIGPAPQRIQPTGTFHLIPFPPIRPAPPVRPVRPRPFP